MENGDKVKLEYMEKDYKNLCKSVEKLSDAYKVINHNSTKTAADVEWLKKAFWLVAAAAIGSLVSNLFQLTQ